MRKVKVKSPLSVKLIVFITLILFVLLSATVALVSVMVSRDVRLSAEEANWSINRQAAQTVRELLKSVRSASFIFMDSAARTLAEGGTSYKKTQQTFWNDNAGIVIPLVNTHY